MIIMETTANPVKVWTAENEDIVIWGTHDVQEAEPFLLAEINGSPVPGTEDTELLPAERAMLAQALRFWGSPDLLGLENWPENSYADTPAQGWVPFLVVSP
jgi:hypothetical protein